MIAFGPIPSRRLGQSLGINTIPPKSCSYNCIYCQVGPTKQTEMERREFYSPALIYKEVRKKVLACRAVNAPIDYLTIVPDGEPTLDIHLGGLIRLLQQLELPIAVITNSSLLWMKEVRKELTLADCVSLKVDAVEADCWKKINRGHDELSLEKIKAGILAFSNEFNGELITETMLVKGINDTTANLEATARFLRKIQVNTAYLAVPSRPPAETWAQSPDETTLTKAYQIFSKHLNSVEILTGFSNETFAVTGDVVNDLLAITSVHPMRESEVLTFLQKGGVNKAQLAKLVDEGKLVRIQHEGQAFYLRKLKLEEVINQP